MSTSAILSYRQNLPGHGYVVGDTGVISQGLNTSAIYVVLSLIGDGVATFNITNGGDGYTAPDSEVATGATTGVGSGFAIDILTVGPSGGGGGSGNMNHVFGGGSKQ